MVHGDQRRLFSRAEKLKVSFCRFNNKDDDILRPFEEIDQIATEKLEGKFQAILLDFELQKSSYATMVLREFCHLSSSFENQELINQTAEPEDKDEDDNLGGQSEDGAMEDH